MVSVEQGGQNTGLSDSVFAFGVLLISAPSRALHGDSVHLRSFETSKFRNDAHLSPLKLSLPNGVI